MPRKRTPKSIPRYMWPNRRPNELDEVEREVKKQLNASLDREGTWLANENLRLVYLEEEFNQTGNPLIAWDCYLYAISHGLKIPEWVFTYFAAVANRLLCSAEEMKDLPKCLGFQVKKGPGPFKLYSLYKKRRRHLAHVLNTVMKEPETSIEAACVDAVEKIRPHPGRSLKWDTVRKRYYKAEPRKGTKS